VYGVGKKTPAIVTMSPGDALRHISPRAMHVMLRGMLPMGTCSGSSWTRTSWNLTNLEPRVCMCSCPALPLVWHVPGHSVSGMNSRPLIWYRAAQQPAVQQHTHHKKPLCDSKVPCHDMTIQTPNACPQPSPCKTHGKVRISTNRLIDLHSTVIARVRDHSHQWLHIRHARDDGFHRHQGPDAWRRHVPQGGLLGFPARLEMHVVPPHELRRELMLWVRCDTLFLLRRASLLELAPAVHHQDVLHVVVLFEVGLGSWEQLVNDLSKEVSVAVSVALHRRHDVIVLKKLRQRARRGDETNQQTDPAEHTVTGNVPCVQLVLAHAPT